MATTTITTSGAEDTRIASAFGIQLGLGRNATAPEIKAEIINFIKAVVRNQERNTAVAALVITDIVPT